MREAKQGGRGRRQSKMREGDGRRTKQGERRTREMVLVLVDALTEYAHGGKQCREKGVDKET
jgi:hypothetical protein